MKKTLFPIVSGIFIIILISFSFSNKYEVNNETYQSGFEDNIKVFAVEIPHNIKFADEKVPLNKFYVKEALEREMTVNTYFHSSSIFLIKKAQRWFPVIEPILKENNIPDDFKYLAVAESGLSQIVSPAGATGIWQIMKHTGRELGLEINTDIDQRYDVELATKAACKYLNKAYEKYGNWTLVAASYNAGTNKISKELERQQQDNYYDMIFGEETGRYVYRILAIKALLEKPEDYGFYLRKKDLYKPYKLKKITVDTAISNIPAFAKSFDLNYKEFKIYNPWIRQAYLANKSRRTYTISIPK
ncbi:MAG: lytic transglycosylase domain-containing protein [Bacteroidetes bacterium]|nr:MAG: lytic transglycosylase domain-containing protein [Bacteroidota bacterium]